MLWFRAADYYWQETRLWRHYGRLSRSYMSSCLPTASIHSLVCVIRQEQTPESNVFHLLVKSGSSAVWRQFWKSKFSKKLKYRKYLCAIKQFPRKFQYLNNSHVFKCNFSRCNVKRFANFCLNVINMFILDQKGYRLANLKCDFWRNEALVLNCKGVDAITDAVLVCAGGFQHCNKLW